MAFILLFTDPNLEVFLDNAHTILCGLSAGYLAYLALTRKHNG